MTSKDLDRFKAFSFWFCCALFVFPVYFFQKGAVPVGPATRAGHSWRLVTFQADPVEYVGLILLTLVFVGAFWGLRSFLIKGLKTVIESEQA